MKRYGPARGHEADLPGRARQPGTDMKNLVPVFVRDLNQDPRRELPCRTQLAPRNFRENLPTRAVFRA